MRRSPCWMVDSGVGAAGGWAAAKVDFNSMAETGPAAVEAHFYAAIRVLELVAGSDRADNLRRHLLPRVLAASAAGAAGA